MLLSLTALQTALEVGAIYSLVALALFISFSILNIADLSTDGCYTLGFAVGATVTLAGHPLLALPAAMAAGACSGFVTAFLQTRLGVESILAGIIVNTGLYTVNLAVMGWSSNLSIYGSDSLFSLAKGLIAADWWNKWHELIVLALILLIVCVLVTAFFRTRLGLSIRATGDNADMVRASSINPAFTITVPGQLPHRFGRMPHRPAEQELRHQPGHRHGHRGPGQPGHRREPDGPGVHRPPGVRRGAGRGAVSPDHRRGHQHQDRAHRGL